MISRSCFLATFASLAVGISSAAHADSSLTIGVPDMPKTLNILNSNHPGAEIVRRATTGSLVQRAGDARVTTMGLSVADAFRAEPERATWLFRVSPLARFSNTRPVTAEDVAFSVNRCRAQGMLPTIASVSRGSGSLELDSAQDWVTFALEPSALKTEQSASIEALSRCPILEHESSEIFSGDLGTGANFVSCGKFAISEVKLGREISLSRKRGSSMRVEISPLENLTLRGFSDPQAALSALRAGTVDAFFNMNPEVTAKARVDETLAAIDCAPYVVIHRKGLLISCPERMFTDKLGYLG